MKNIPWTISILENLHPVQSPPWTVPTLENLHLEKSQPWTIYTLENSPPWTISSLESLHPGQYHPKNLHAGQFPPLLPQTAQAAHLLTPFWRLSGALNVILLHYWSGKNVHLMSVSLFKIA